MAVGSNVMLGFARCGMYGGGSGPWLPDAEARTVRPGDPERGDLGPGEPCGRPAVPCVGRATGLIITAGALMFTVFAVAIMADGHRSLRLTFRHLSLVFTDRAIQRVVRDPFLVGAGLCVLAALGFVLVAAATISPASPARPAVQQVLTGGRRWVGRRPRRRTVRRLRSVARRPPSMVTTRPGGRPVTRKRVLGRTDG